MISVTWQDGISRDDGLIPAAHAVQVLLAWSAQGWRTEGLGTVLVKVSLDGVGEMLNAHFPQHFSVVSSFT